MTIINEAYIPTCAAQVVITIPPTRTLQAPPRPVPWQHVAAYLKNISYLILSYI